MLTRLFLLCLLFFAAGCELVNPEPVVRVAASSLVTGTAEAPKERLIEISDDLEVRRGQFARLTEVLSRSEIGQESPALQVSMTFCRSLPDRLPEVGGPGTTATRWLQIRSMDDGGTELLAGSSNSDARANRQY